MARHLSTRRFPGCFVSMNAAQQPVRQQHGVDGALCFVWPTGVGYGPRAMSSVTDNVEQDQQAPARKRLRPHQLVVALGAGIAAFTALSGVASVVFQFEDDAEVSRAVFVNIPSGVKLAFYT